LIRAHQAFEQESGMKYLSIPLILFFLAAGGCFTAASAKEDKVPLSVGGFTLGTSIDKYDFISYRNFLKQVVIDQIPGFRKGMIEYGVCDRPGEIVRIKLKYLDSSKGFYKQLLRRYKQRFGEPDEFAGDPFGIVKAWKWHFKSKDGRRITLTLQNNLKNPDETIGNMVKLTMPDQIEAERKCFNKTCAMRHPKGEEMKKAQWGEDHWKLMIPR
jgi:hypothetical protein